jgi:hypothetical protein
MPSGALSSDVPTVDRQRIFPAFRSTATVSPHGGLLQGTPSGDIARRRVIAKGAPRCSPNSNPFAGFKPLDLGSRCQLDDMDGTADIGVEDLVDRTNAAPPQFTPPPVIG